MNAEQLAHLVEDIVQTWPTGVRGRIWTAQLAHLDHDVASGVYEHLATHDEKPPSVARFLAIAASTQPELGFDRPADTGEPISLNEYLRRHPEDTELLRTRHPSTKVKP